MRRLDIIKSFKFKMSRNYLEKIYLSFVLPILEYGDALWDGAQDYELDKLDQVHIRAMRIITGATERSSTQRLYVNTGWPSLSQHRKCHRLK